ncbi:MAG: TRAP transporter small permease [Desulfobacterales bacterium]
MVTLLDRLSRSINRGVEYLLFVFGLSMAAIVAAQVFSRYVLNNSLFWSEELARFLLVWLTFLGASAAYCRKAHPGVDFLYARVAPALQRIFSVVTHLASLTLFSVMIVYGCRFAWFVRMQISPALQIPKWIILAIVPISGVILAVHGLAFLAGALKVTGHDR